MVSTSQEVARYCKGCGYDLRGSEGRCPECGRGFDAENSRRVRVALFGVVGILVLLGAVWGWFYWGWAAEQRALARLEKPPTFVVTQSLARKLAKVLGPGGFVFNRVHRIGFASLAGSSMSDMSDLTPLAGLKELRDLELDHTGVSDLKPLAGLKGLRKLGLDGSPVSDLSPLVGLEQLEWLSANGTGVRDLSPLAGLKELKSIYFRHTGVKDLTPLAGLGKLRIIRLPQGTIADEQVVALQRALPGCDIGASEP